MRSVVGAVQLGPDVGDPSDLVGSRLLRLYRPVLGEQTSVQTVLVARARALVVAVTDVPTPPLSIGDRIACGGPVGFGGEASDREITGAIANPTKARDLLGVYVLVGIDRSRVRIVTSAALPKTLIRVNGPSGTAFATRALAGHILTGKRPQISEAVAVDFVLFDFPTGPEELLAESTVLDEASVIDLTPSGVRQGAYWDAAERLAPGAATTPHRLRSVLTDVGRRVVQVPKAHLALTAGRDSTLVAACVAEVGLRMPSFTLGQPEMSDAVGAAHTAQALGWTHRCVPIGARPPADRFAEVVRWAPWHEGLQRAWDYSGSWLDWDTRDAFYIGGHGGEIGRAFYGPSPANLDDAVRVLAKRGASLDNAARERLTARLTSALTELRGFGRPSSDLLDLFYARYRTHHLFVRFAPFSQFRAFATPYLEPAVVSALLDIPIEQRDGSLFDETIRLLRPELAASAIQRTEIWMALHPPHAARKRALDRLRRWLRGEEGWQALGQTIKGSGGAPYMADVLGEGWWSWAVRAARRGNGYARWRLWNALAIESFHAWLDHDELTPVTHAQPQRARLRSTLVHNPSGDPVVD